MHSGAAERRAVMVCPEAPFPVVGGGPLRTASIVHYLAQRYALDVIVFREPGAPDPRAGFPGELARRVCVLELPEHRKDMPARLARNLVRCVKGVPPHEDRFRGFRLPLDGRYQLGVIEHFWASSYATQLRPVCEKLVLDLHNLESVFYERRAEAEGGAFGAILGRFARLNRRLEARRYPEFDVLLCTSEADVRATGQRHAVVVPNTSPWHEPVAPGDDPAVAFSGNMEFPPNMTAVDWFAREIWPGLVDAFPEARWRLIGKNPEAVEPLVAMMPNVQVTGPVEDAVRELGRCRVAVVPLRSGSGTRLKIIEAWAAGIPVVSTTVGAEGLEARDGEHLLVADTAEGFQEAVGRLMRDASLRERIGKCGRGLYEERYTWSTAWQKLAEAGI